MAQYVEIEEAKGMSGLRVGLTPSVPGPWTESAKAILRVKNLPQAHASDLFDADGNLVNTSHETARPRFSVAGGT